MCTDKRLNEVKASNPDIVIIMGGANDAVYSIPIGEQSDITSKNVSTFKGAYAKIIETLLTWKPTLRLIILSGTWSIAQINTYSDASVEIANYYNVPVVEIKKNMGVNLLNYANFYKDGVHPNAAGGKRMAELIFKTLDYVIYL